METTATVTVLPGFRFALVSRIVGSFSAPPVRRQLVSSRRRRSPRVAEHHETGPVERVVVFLRRERRYDRLLQGGCGFGAVAVHVPMEVAHEHTRGGGIDFPLKLNLTDMEKSDLVAFVESLTGTLWKAESHT